MDNMRRKAIAFASGGMGIISLSFLLVDIMFLNVLLSLTGAGLTVAGLVTALEWSKSINKESNS